MKYKYLGSDEYSLKPVTEGTIKYSLITDLNDPFEVLSTPSPEYAEKTTTEGIDLLKKKTLREVIEEKGDKFQTLFKSIFDSAPPEVEKEQLLNTSMEEFMKIDHPGWNMLYQNIDPRNHQNSESSRQRKSQSALADQFAILCLSSDPASYLMWSHYAEKHTGFCIGFDDSNGWFHPLDNLFSLVGKPSSEKPKNSKYICNLRKVKYRKKRPVFDDVIDKSSVFHPYFRKSKKWQYEKEYRMLYPLDLAQDAIHISSFSPEEIDPSKSLFKHNKNLYVRAFNRSIIKEIIFGCKCSIDTQKIIRDALKEYDVSYKFAIPSSVDYSIIIKDSQLDYPHDPLNEELLRKEMGRSYFDPKYHVELGLE